MPRNAPEGVISSYDDPKLTVELYGLLPLCEACRKPLGGERKRGGRGQQVIWANLPKLCGAHALVARAVRVCSDGLPPPRPAPVCPVVAPQNLTDSETKAVRPRKLLRAAQSLAPDAQLPQHVRARTVMMADAAVAGGVLAERALFTTARPAAVARRGPAVMEDAAVAGGVLAERDCETERSHTLEQRVAAAERAARITTRLRDFLAAFHSGSAVLGPSVRPVSCLCTASVKLTANCARFTEGGSGGTVQGQPGLSSRLVHVLRRVGGPV